MGSQEPAATQKFQRRQVIVKRTLQYKYIALVFFGALLASAIVGLDIYYNMSRIILNESPSLQPLIRQYNVAILVRVAMYLCVMLLIAVFVSHRFAGPIFRFEKSAQIVASGDLTHRVSLRTGDELMELQEEFNGMISSLQGLVGKDRALVGHLETRLEEALKKLPDNPAAAREDMISMKVELHHLTRAFKV